MRSINEELGIPIFLDAGSVNQIDMSGVMGRSPAQPIIESIAAMQSVWLTKTDIDKMLKDREERFNNISLEMIWFRMFEIVLKNPPNTMTRVEWYQMNSRFRYARRKISQHFERSSSARL